MIYLFPYDAEHEGSSGSGLNLPVRRPRAREVEMEQDPAIQLLQVRTLIINYISIQFTYNEDIDFEFCYGAK